MLAREFYSPLHLCRDDAGALVREAFAHTLLSSYNTNLLSTRVATSFSRAYKATTLRSVARVDGGRPGFVVATYREPGYDRLLVAIEPTSNAYQLLAGGEGFTTSAEGTTGARVWAPLRTYALQILDLLDTYPEFQALGTTGQVYDECWAGFSLGAGIAEVCAKRRAFNIPSRRLVKAYKFASPRVGNTTWVAWTPRNYADTNYYHDRDPVDAIPLSGIHNGSTFTERLIGSMTSLAANPRQTRLDGNGEIMENPTSWESTRAIGAYADLAGRANGGNNWYDHTMNRYWTALAGGTGFSDTQGFYRFAFLDYEDTNNAGQARLAFGRTAGFPRGMVDPAPADFTNNYLENLLGGDPTHRVTVVLPNVPIPAAVQTVLQVTPPVRVAQPIAEPVERPRANWRPRRMRHAP